jgi:hypothetical protein
VRQSCSTCDAFDKKEYGCRKPLQYAAWDFNGIEYKSCPVAFITPQVRAWHEKYSLMKKYGGFNYESMNARDVAAIVYFDNAYDVISAMVKRPGE